MMLYAISAPVDFVVASCCYVTTMGPRYMSYAEPWSMANDQPCQYCGSKPATSEAMDTNSCTQCGGPRT